MAENQDLEVPQTLEGWYVLHEVYAVDWARLRETSPDTRGDLAREASNWLREAAGSEGDSAAYSVVTQKGDLMFVHYRPTPDDLNRMELALRGLQLFDYLIPSYSFLSVIEVSLYELTGIAHKRLADQGIRPGSAHFDDAFAQQMEEQKARVKDRLYCSIPDHDYICFYPMNKRRGEQVNWYSLSMDERRKMMRGHGRIGHKYHREVKQIIGGSVGLDDWEWGVSLHANSMLPFKKLIYEMRFDPASALFAEFGPFYLGIRREPDQLPDLLAGKLS